MCYLYRGVSEEYYEKMGGRIIPAGKKSEVVMTHGDYLKGVEMHRDGKFVRVLSETNTVRAHHLKSGLHDGCFISTTRDIERAKRFATIRGMTDGYIYVIDPSKFFNLGVVAYEFSVTSHDEQEVSIRASDNGEIPSAVIFKLLRVKSNEYQD